MKDKYKTKKHLIEELEALRKQVVKMKEVEVKRKRSEEGLQETEDRYCQLFEDAPISLGIEDHSVVKKHIDNLRDKGVKDFREYFLNHPEEVNHCATLVKMVDGNKATLKLYKAKSKEEFQEGLCKVFSEESYDMFREELIGIADGKTWFEGETINQTLAGDKIHIFLRWSVVAGYEQTLSRVLVSIIDITERKQAEEALKRKSEEQALLLDNIQTRIWYLKDPETYGAVNKAHAEFLGKKKEELENKNLYEIYSKEEAEVCISGNREVFEKKIQLHTEEWVTNAKGEKRLMDIIKSPKLDENGNVEYVVCSAHDITERKQAEEALLESEKRFRNLADLLPQTVFEMDERGNLTFVNRQGFEAFGYTKEDFARGLNALQTIAPKDRDRAAENILKRVNGEELGTNEYTALRKDGSTFPISLYSNRIIHGNKPMGLRGIIIDLTERKKAEEAFQTSHRFLEIANRHMVMNPLLNEFVAEVQTFTKCAAVGIRILDEEGNIPYQAYKGFSQRFYESESPLSIKSDQCMCINVIKGTADPKLPFYTECGSFYMNYTTRFLSTVSEEKKGQTCNLCNQFGYESVALVPIRLGERILGLIHVAAPQENMVRLDKVEILERIATQLGIAIQRVKLEETLRESKKQYRNLFENANDIVYTHDLAGNFTSINRAAERLTGYTGNEAVKMNISQVVAPEYLESIRKMLVPEFLGKGPLIHELDIITKHGRRLPLELSTRLIFKKGKPVRVRGIGRDITERKKAEEERKRLFEQVLVGREYLRKLSRRLVELQEIYRRDLARELHDRIGQNLTALSINLNITRGQLSAESATKIGVRLEDSQRLLEETVEHIRDVMAELRPPVLDEYGLMAALRWYGERFSKQTNIQAIIQGEELTPRLPVPMEIVLFRIAQEALTNVAKHSQARQVIITLESLYKEARLTIADYGVGFDSTAHHQPGAPPGWGLLTMRERAEAISGQFYIETAPGRGTKVIVEVPRNK